MKARDLWDLTLLAAIWGSSFLFMRMAAPDFGPIALSFVRVAGAALCLLPLLLWPSPQTRVLRQRAGGLTVVGLFNSALPFLCFGYAALTLPAGLASIFNAATPLATALIGWLWLDDRLTRWRSLGLGIGFAGVVGLAAWRATHTGAAAGAALSLDLPQGLAILACLAATMMYGFAGNFTRRHMAGVPPLTMAAGSQSAAALALALPAWLAWPAVNPPPIDWLAALALAVVCSGVAYILYFRLIQRVGSTAAASVTFLVPVFATGWGAVVLAEPVTPAMVVGGAVILLGTSLSLGLWPRTRDAIRS